MKFIGITDIWYGAPIETPVTAQSLSTLLSGSTLKKVPTVHNGTFAFSQDDDTTEEYKNEFTGETYYEDVTEKGKMTLSFTIADYTFEQNEELGGGTASDDGNVWSNAGSNTDIMKSFIAKTKTGNYFVFTYGKVRVKTDTQSKMYGLGVTVTPLENPSSTTSNVVASFYKLKGTAVDA